MDHTLSGQHDRARRRAAIESIIARYPGIAEHELYAVFDYYRHEATPADRRAIARNRAIRVPYQRLCRDHRLDRLGPIWRPLALVLAIGAALTAIYLVLQGTEL